MNSHIKTVSRWLAKRFLVLLLVLSTTSSAFTSAANARFISPDDWDPSKPGVGTNRYSYAQNDPINLSDPNGHFIEGSDDPNSPGFEEAGKNDARQSYDHGDISEQEYEAAVDFYETNAAARDAEERMRKDGGMGMSMWDAANSANAVAAAVLGGIGLSEELAGKGTKAAAGGNLESAKPSLLRSKETGSYTNTHESGMTYSGKGTRARSQESAKRVERATKDKHIATEWVGSTSTRNAFKDESRRIDAAGGVQSPSNYNKIQSPGFKYRQEDNE